MQAYLLFGDEDYLTMFAKLYTSAMHGLTLRLGAGAPGGAATPPPWLAHADMQTGKLAHPWISSLSAFWPALQALAGSSTLTLTYLQPTLLLSTCFEAHAGALHSSHVHML